MRPSRASPLLVLVVTVAPLTGCGPSLERVEPSVVPAGQASTVTAFGQGLTGDLAYRLEGEGVEVVTPVLEADGDSAALRVPASAPAGVYDLVAGEVRLPASLTLTQERLRLVFLDVGQGDATLVLAPGGEVALVDGGPPGSEAALLAALEERAAGRLDAVIVSHFDADHLGGLVELLDGEDDEPGTEDDLRPATLWSPVDEGGCDSQICERFRALSAYPSLVTPAPGDELGFAEITVEAVAVDGRVDSGSAPAGLDDNARSLVLDVAWQGRRALILGDLTGGGLGTVDLEGPLAEATGPVDVLRLAHHGSATSSNGAALDAWAARLGVLSVGTDNAYCHPAPGPLERAAERVGRVVATGRGIVEDAARCDGATDAPAGVSLGQGDVVVDIAADGAVTLGDGAEAELIVGGAAGG